MRIAIVAMLPSPAAPGGPVYSWFDEESTEQPFDEAVARLIASSSDGMYVLVDTIEIGTANTARVAAKAVDHIKKSATRHLNIAWLYHHDLAALKIVSPGGVLSGTIRAPKLTADDVEAVLRALTRSSIYNNQSIAAYSDDGTQVTVKGSKVERRPGGIFGNRG